MHKGMGSILGTTLKLDVMMHTYNPSNQEVEAARGQEGKKLEVILNYVVSQSLAWTT